MSKSNHTPGPWGVGEAEHSADWTCGVRRVRGGDGDHLVCELPNWGWAEQGANARLIAAAPDLLALLEKALPMIQCEASNREAALDNSRYATEIRELADEIEAQIEKARGE